MVSAFYILMKGQLKVFLSQEGEVPENLRRRDVALNILNEGDCFGEYSLIDKRPASASIISIGPGAISRISGEDLTNILQNDDHMARTIYLSMLKILIKRLRNKDREYEEIYDKLDSKTQTILKSFLPLIF